MPGPITGGNSFDPASPGPIGGTTPAAITGTTITATTQFSGPNGSLGTPAIVLANGSQTGFYSNSANMITFVASGTAVFTMRNIGIVADASAASMFVGGTGTIGWNGVNSNLTAVSTAITFTTNNVVAMTLTGAAGPITTLTIGGAPAGATTQSRIVKAVTAIADNVATDVLTVTIPNAAHSASLRVRLVGSLGAGGAIGANEATGTIEYDFAIARTAGVNAVVGISSAYGSATSAVAGAATIAVTAAASAVSGAVGATNTFTVQVTITRGSGSSDNHTCRVEASLVNANATGITAA